MHSVAAQQIDRAHTAQKSLEDLIRNGHVREGHFAFNVKLSPLIASGKVERVADYLFKALPGLSDEGRKRLIVDHMCPEGDVDERLFDIFLEAARENLAGMVRAEGEGYVGDVMFAGRGGGWVTAFNVVTVNAIYDDLDIARRDFQDKLYDHPGGHDDMTVFGTLTALEDTWERLEDCLKEAEAFLKVYNSVEDMIDEAYKDLPNDWRVFLSELAAHHLGESWVEIAFDKGYRPAS